MFLLRPRHRRDDGASAVEYALLVAAIAAVLLAVIFGLASIVKDAFENTTSCVNGAGNGCTSSTSP